MISIIQKQTSALGNHSVNNRRLLAAIGHIPPAEAEANYYAALKETAIAA
jgi:transposase InsO family protein